MRLDLPLSLQPVGEYFSQVIRSQEEVLQHPFSLHRRGLHPSVTRSGHTYEIKGKMGQELINMHTCHQLDRGVYAWGLHMAGSVAYELLMSPSVFMPEQPSHCFLIVKKNSVTVTMEIALITLCSSFKRLSCFSHFPHPLK